MIVHRGYIPGLVAGHCKAEFIRPLEKVALPSNRYSISARPSNHMNPSASTLTRSEVRIHCGPTRSAFASRAAARYDQPPQCRHVSRAGVGDKAHPLMFLNAQARQRVFKLRSK